MPSNIIFKIKNYKKKKKKKDYFCKTILLAVRRKSLGIIIILVLVLNLCIPQTNKLNKFTHRPIICIDVSHGYWEKNMNTGNRTDSKDHEYRMSFDTWHS